VIATRHLTDDEAQLLVDGLLPAEDHSRVRQHHDACAECQALVLSFRALDEALAGLPVAEPPPDFTTGVMARIDARERTVAFERRVAASLLGAMALAIAVLVGLAGPAAWGPVLSALSSGVVRAIQAVRLSGDVLGPVVAALRMQILVGAAVLGLPLLLALSRLIPARQRQVA
jgi:anti-sigma factor RsiW